jgi:hypothetical protein
LRRTVPERLRARPLIEIIISSCRFFDHDKAAGVSRDNAELIELTERTLADAFAAGQLRSGDLKQDRQPGAGLRLCQDEHRRPFSTLGGRRRRGRAGPPRRSSVCSSRGSPGGREFHRHSGACEARTMVRNCAPENLEIPGSLRAPE